MSLYGSIHTHFESQFDTGNDLKKMCENFAALGAKKVAVTEHGTFTSFEDLREIAAKMDGFEIIPGVEGYFGEKAAHVVLIAKNYRGYQSLCKIISESNANMVKGKPIIALENLQKNVSKGDIICTSACIGGLFGSFFGLVKSNAERKIKELEEELSKSDFDAIAAIEKEYQELLALSTQKTAQKRKNAEKAFKQYGNRKALENVEALERQIEDAKLELERRGDEFKANRKLFRPLSKKIAKLEELKKELGAAPSVEKTMREAKRLYNDFVKIFGKKDFYFELQNHGLDSEAVIYSNLVSFAKEVGHTNFIASNDIHIGTTKADKDEYEAYLVRREVIKFTRFKSNIYTPIGADDFEYYIKTDEELKEGLLKIIDDEAIVDSAIANIENSLSECAVEFPKDEKYYPVFCADETAEFDHLIQKGIPWRFPKGFDEKHQKRLEYEVSVIKSMGFVGYHLIVADYLNYARLLGYLPKNEIPNAPLSIPELEELIEKRGIKKIGYNIGPGRGSACGSLVCYLLGITDLDPLDYDLLFERFLNVERVTMPDIDADFRIDVRERAIDYVKARYGEWHVCQIITKAYGALKGNLRLAARYLGAKECFTKNKIPKTTGADIMKKWYQIGDEIAKKVEVDEAGNEFVSDTDLKAQSKSVLKLANTLDGVFTSYGQHAAGTIISGCDLTNIIPLMYNDIKKNYETQCTMAQAEEKGVLKMDFLGLKTLNIITDIEILSKDARIQDPALRKEILSEKDVYEHIFQSGLTQGVFQFESDGMKSMLKEFKPESFEDLILLVAAYRPGPMDYIPEIIAKKWWIKNGCIGPEPSRSITLKNSALEKILEPTYGCPIYQEQIMQIFQTMAGYSLGGADIVRRYMSKKKSEALAKEKVAFVHGDEKRGIPGIMKLHGVSEQEAETLFEQMMPFAKYGFNKSHAAAYALVSYFTAWQKHHYPAYFYATVLNYTEKLAEIQPLAKEMPSLGIELAPPSLLLSSFDFRANNNVVRFGLKYIKNLSEKEFIPLPNPVDFVYANPDLGYATIEKYVRLGLFDEYCRNRQQLGKWVEENCEKIIAFCKTQEEIEELREAGEKSSAKTVRSREEKLAQLEREIKQPGSYHEIPADIMEDRKYEYENLGTVFSVKESMALLQKQPDRTSFSALANDAEYINAIVLSSVGPKTSKSGKSTYYEVVLMDCEGNETTRRFDAPVTVTEGRFYLTSDEERFFSNSVKNVRPLRFRTFYLREATEEVLQKLRSNNGNVEVHVKDNSFINFCTTEKKIKELPEDSGFYLDFS